MTPTKLLIGQIVAVSAVMILGVWVATQWAAAQLGYQSELGAPWAKLGALPVYRPWLLFDWWFHYEAYAPGIFDQAGLIAGASVSSAAPARSRDRSGAPGRAPGPRPSARCAGPWRAGSAAGLFRGAGVFLGRLGDRYLRHDAPEHVMAFALPH